MADPAVLENPHAQAARCGGQAEREVQRVQVGRSVFHEAAAEHVGADEVLEILVFDIDVEPVTGGGRRSVQFKREFFGD